MQLTFPGATGTGSRNLLECGNARLLQLDHAAIDAIARETSAPLDVVKALCEGEVATLAAQATIEQFVGVIAVRRVKQRLRQMGWYP